MATTGGHSTVQYVGDYAVYSTINLYISVCTCW